MQAAKETEKEVKRLVKENLPKAKVSHIRIEDSSDAEGQPSINIWVVFEAKPVKKELQNTDALIDAFRTWLSKKGDSRFPYFSFLTLKDEKELLHS